MLMTGAAHQNGGSRHFFGLAIGVHHFVRRHINDINSKRNNVENNFRQIAFGNFRHYLLYFCLTFSMVSETFFWLKGFRIYPLAPASMASMTICSCPWDVTIMTSALGSCD